jgi:hypothetical protein
VKICSHAARAAAVGAHTVTYTLHFVGAGSVVASMTLTVRKRERKRELSARYEKEWCEYDAIYKDDRDGLRGPLPPVMNFCLQRGSVGGK